jgi:predicted membrane protein
MVTSRNPKELIPLLLAIVSAAIVLGMPADLPNSLEFLETWAAPAIASVLCALSGISIGFRHLKRNGPNAVAWLGVTACILVVTFDLAYLIIFYFWSIASN